MIVYFLLIPIIFIASVVAAEKDRFGYLLIVVALLAIFAGFRAENVGIDTPAYISKLECIANGEPDFAYGLEPGFKLWAKYVLKINNSYTFFFTVVALITNLLIVRRLWDFRYVASIPCMVLCYYASFYGYTFNIIRQFLAIAVIFFSSKFLDKRKYIKFAIIVLLCTMFLHRSSIICLGYIAADIFMWRDLSKQQRNIICIGIIAVVISSGFIVSHLSVKYAKYFQIAVYNIGFMILIKLVFFFASMYISKKILIPTNIDKNIVANYQEYRMKKATTIYYPISLLLTSIGYFFPLMDRIGLYYGIFECVYFGMLTKTHFDKSIVNDTKYNRATVRNNAIVFRILICVLVGYIFIVGLLDNSQGIVPYRFV